MYLLGTRVRWPSIIEKYIIGIAANAIHNYAGLFVCISIINIIIRIIFIVISVVSDWFTGVVLLISPVSTFKGDGR